MESFISLFQAFSELFFFLCVSECVWNDEEEILSEFISRWSSHSPRKFSSLLVLSLFSFPFSHCSNRPYNSGNARCTTYSVCIEYVYTHTRVCERESLLLAVSLRTWDKRSESVRNGSSFSARAAKGAFFVIKWSSRKEETSIRKSCPTYPIWPEGFIEKQ